MTTEKKPIRNERFNYLLKHKFKGVKAAMAKELEIDASLVWRYANGKGIGEDMKLHIEEKLKLGIGWMDGITDEQIKTEDDEIDLLELIGLTKESLDLGQIERLKAFAKASKEQQLEALSSIKKRRTSRSKGSGEGKQGS